MNIGIMQPYFFPYIGYWQLIGMVDKFVIYDNIEFTKRSWIRRNRILVDGNPKMITLPIKNDSDYLDIRDRLLSEDFVTERIKLLNQIKMAYKKSPQFDDIFPLVENCMMYENKNLFEFIYYSIQKIVELLEFETEIIISSQIDMNHNLKGKNRVIETCHRLKSENYINTIGGLTLYDKHEFKRNGIDLSFLEVNPFKYKQFGSDFIPNLSIIDVLMFNSKNKVKEMLLEYKLI